MRNFLPPTRNLRLNRNVKTRTATRDRLSLQDFLYLIGIIVSLLSLIRRRTTQSTHGTLARSGNLSHTITQRRKTHTTFLTHLSTRLLRRNVNESTHQQGLSARTTNQRIKTLIESVTHTIRRSRNLMTTLNGNNSIISRNNTHRVISITKVQVIKVIMRRLFMTQHTISRIMAISRRRLKLIKIRHQS